MIEKDLISNIFILQTYNLFLSVYSLFSLTYNLLFLSQFYPFHILLEKI